MSNKRTYQLPRTARLIVLLIAVLMMTLAMVPTQTAGKAGVDPDTPYLAPESRVQWWKDMKFGLFIHWGPWSQTGQGRIWDMTDLEEQDEGNKYLELYKTFNPINFNPDEWARLAKLAGIKYVVFTTKHHDGFSNWDSEGTDLNITNPDCPCSQNENPDLTGRIIEAFREKGIAIGLYYSHIDWYHEDAKIFSHSHWEYKAGNVDTYPVRWENYVEFERSQVNELLTRYGSVDIFWFDIAWPYAGTGKKVTHAGVREDVFDLVKQIRSTHPNILINNRGVDIHGDFFTPEQRIPNQGLPGNWEANLTISNGGGYWWRGPDSEYKTTKEMVRMLVDVVAKGGNFLMNVGPQPDGQLTAQEIDRLNGIGEWMEVHGDSIYGTDKCVFRSLDWGRCTVKGDQLYLHVFDWPEDGILKMRGLKNQVQSAWLLADPDKLLQLEQREGDVSIQVGHSALNDIDTVVVLTVKGTPDADRSIQANFDGVVTLRADEATVTGNTAAFSFGHGTTRGDHIGEWTTTDNEAAWEFKLRDAGTYTVSLVYSAEQEHVSSALTITAGSKAIEGTSEFTGAPLRIKGSGQQYAYEERTIGDITFDREGVQTISVKATRIGGKEFMKLKTVKLSPQK